MVWIRIKPVLVGPRLKSGCLQAYQWSVKRLGMGWGLIPIVPGLEQGCFHRQKFATGSQGIN